MPCQQSVCLFTSALGSNSNKMDDGDGVELCFLAYQYYVSEVINRCCHRTPRPYNRKMYFHCLKKPRFVHCYLKSLDSSVKRLYDTIELYTF